MNNLSKAATFLVLTILLNSVKAASKLKVNMERVGPPCNWKTATVTDVRLVVHDPDVLRALKEDPRNMMDRRIYSIDNGEQLLQFENSDSKFNHKAFQKPCMNVGDAIEYRTQVMSSTGTWVTPGVPSGRSSLTTTYVELKRRKNCGALSVSESSIAAPT
jgi:hypothetical protein